MTVLNVKSFLKKLKIFIPYLLLFLTAGILAWKSKYGFGWNDESFYFSLVHRFATGETPLIDEWFEVQTFAPFLIPFYKLYILFVGDVEGIYLYFRIIFLLLNLVIGIFIYYMINKYENQSGIALVAAIIFMIYAKENIQTESYYSLSLQATVMAFLLLYQSCKIKNKVCNLLLYFCTGIFLAISVAANPFLIIPYTAAVIIYLLIGFIKDKKIIINILIFVLGSFSVAIMYVSYILKSVTIKELIHNLPHVIINDEHPAKNIFIDIIRWGWYSVKPFGMNTKSPQEIAAWYLYIPIIIFLMIILIILLANIKNYEIEYRFQMFITFVSLALLVRYSYNTPKLVGAVYIPFSLIGIIIYLLTKNKNRDILKLFYVPGLILSVMYQYASNTGIGAITVGYVLCAMASVIFISDYINENKSRERMNFNIILYIAIVFIVSTTLFNRLTYTFKDDSVFNLDYEIDRGPWKGVVTNQDFFIQYNEICNDLEFIRITSNEENNIFISNLLPWGYVYLNNKIGAPSVGTNLLKNIELPTYYKLHPNKQPDYIFIVNENYASHNDDNPLQGIIRTMIINENYKKKVMDSGILYYR